MKKGLIFDMDGTLWDSSKNVAASWNEKLKLMGVEYPEITQEDLMRVMGLTMDKVADGIFSRLPQEKRLALLEEVSVYENEYILRHGAELYPDLEDTLKVLSKNYGLYIVSNCQQGYIEAFLEHYGFGKYFADIECYGNNLKQKGDNIALIVQRNDLDKAWYVGDIQGDFDAASYAGTGFIHAAYGFGTINQEVPELKKFKDLPELMKIIDK